MAKTAIYSVAVLMIALAASTGIIFAKQSQDQSTSTNQPLLQVVSNGDACPCGGDCACQANGSKCQCGQNGQTCSCSGQSKCHAKTSP